jgi:hypothetical protein
MNKLTEDTILTIYSDIVLSIKKSSSLNECVENIKDSLLNEHFNRKNLSSNQMKTILDNIITNIEKDKIILKTQLLSTILIVLYEQLDESKNTILVSPIIINDDYCYISQNYLDHIDSGDTEFWYKEYINIKSHKKFLDLIYELEQEHITEWNSSPQVYVKLKEVVTCKTNLKNKEELKNLLILIDKKKTFIKICNYISKSQKGRKNKNPYDSEESLFNELSSAIFTIK